MSTDTDTHKRCSSCGEIKPRSKYYVFHVMPDGLMSQCKACHNGLRELHRQQAAFFAERQLGDPSEEQIAAECRKFQQRWTPGKRQRAIERARRATGGVA